jgi:hypothetical protein
MWNVDVRAEMLADMPLYKRVRRELLDEIYDNDMSLFLNFRSITLKDWENLNCATGSFEMDYFPGWSYMTDFTFEKNDQRA